MFWTIVLAICLFCVGAWVASYGVIMPIIVLRVSFPLTRVLKNSEININAKAINKLNAGTLILWGAIDAATIALVVLFAGNLPMYAFFAGMAFCVFIGLPRSGMTAENGGGYCELARKAVPPEEFEAMQDIVRGQYG